MVKILSLRPTKEKVIMNDNELIYRYKFYGVVIYASKAEFTKLFELLPNFPYEEEYIGERRQIEGESGP